MAKKDSIAKKDSRVKNNKLDWPASVGVIYSAVRREDFATEAQYITEQGAEQDAHLIGEYLGTFGVDVRLYPGDEALAQRLMHDKPEMLFNLVDFDQGPGKPGCRHPWRAGAAGYSLHRHRHAGDGAGH